VSVGLAALMTLWRVLSRGRLMRCSLLAACVTKGVHVNSDIPPFGPDWFSVVDTTTANTARVWNYWLGGKDNYPVDEQVGDQISAVMPQIIDLARAVRGFLVRAVTYLVDEAGIHQFLDIGTGLPTANNTHEVAQATNPQCRVVYVDNDPLIMAHARALLTSTPEGATDYVHADVRDTGTILQQAARTLDLSQPVALMLLGIMEHIADDEEAYALVNQLLDALVSGSYLVLSDPTTDIETEMMREAIRLWNNNAKPLITSRSRQQIARFFNHLKLLEPGIVSVSLWRPHLSNIGTPVEVGNIGGVGQKP
jgi:S-adenosyl methyltransferase